MEERVTLGPKVAEGENVFGVAHIFASFNDTFVVRPTSLGRNSTATLPLAETSSGTRGQ